MDATHLFANTRLVPVIVLQDADIAVALAETLLGAGIKAMEITLRTAPALYAIEAVATAVPEMLVGAGSVRHAGQVAAVASAGGQFLVSPGSTPNLLSAVAKAGLPFVPGAVTPTEIMHLTEAGYTLVKFFPAELSGGIATLKAFAEPLSETLFFPTGSISGELAPHYLALDCVACIGGSWFVPKDLLAAADLAGIAALSAAAAALCDA